MDQACNDGGGGTMLNRREFLMMGAAALLTAAAACAGEDEAKKAGRETRELFEKGKESAGNGFRSAGDEAKKFYDGLKEGKENK
jgi:hypothetical protein